MTKPVVHRIITWARAEEIRTLHYPLSGDTLTDEDAQTAMAENRPAYWSFHVYHNAVFCVAAGVANRIDLEAACDEVAAAAIERDKDARQWVREFLLRLAPANLSGLLSLDDAMAKWAGQRIDHANYFAAMELSA